MPFVAMSDSLSAGLATPARLAAPAIRPSNTLAPTAVPAARKVRRGIAGVGITFLFTIPERPRSKPISEFVSLLFITVTSTLFMVQSAKPFLSLMCVILFHDIAFSHHNSPSLNTFRGLCSEKRDFAHIDGHHQLLTYRSVLFVTHVRSSPHGKRDALNRSKFVDILRSGEAPRSLDSIVVSPQKVIGTKVEVLFAAVARDFLGKLHT